MPTAAHKQIYELLPKVMASVGVVGKNQKNPQQNYQYRGVDDVMAAVQSALIEHNVTVRPAEVSNLRTEQLLIGKNKTPMIHVVAQVKYVWSAPDGSEVVSEVIAEATDSSDKAANKAMATAYKYAVTQTLSIPTAEAKDPETDSHELGGTQQPDPDHSGEVAPDDPNYDF